MKLEELLAIAEHEHKYRKRIARVEPNEVFFPAGCERRHGITRRQINLSNDCQRLLVEIFPEIVDGLPVTITGETITLIE